MSHSKHTETDESIKFAEEYVTPIAKGEKTATVRHDLDFDVRVGDVLTARLPDGTEFTTLRVRRVAQCNAVEVLSIFEVFQEFHGADTVDELLESLNEHYDTAIRPSTTVHVIGFEVVRDAV